MVYVYTLTQECTSSSKSASNHHVIFPGLPRLRKNTAWPILYLHLLQLFYLLTSSGCIRTFYWKERILEGSLFIYSITWGLQSQYILVGDLHTCWKTADVYTDGETEELHFKYCQISLHNVTTNYDFLVLIITHVNSCTEKYKNHVYATWWSNLK